MPESHYVAIAVRSELLAIPLSEPPCGAKAAIYHVALDGYSGADVLKGFYGCDMPGKREDAIPQATTPVNLFRIILSEYFGADLDLLENRQYFTKDQKRKK